MVGYYRGFPKNVATVLSLFTDLLSSFRVFCWNADCEVAFKAAKDLQFNAPVLATPNFTRPFRLEVL